MGQFFIVLPPISKRDIEIGVTPPRSITKYNHVFMMYWYILKYEMDGCEKNNPFLHIYLLWFLQQP